MSTQAHLEALLQQSKARAFFGNSKPFSRMWTARVCWQWSLMQRCFACHAFCIMAALKGKQTQETPSALATDFESDPS